MLIYPHTTNATDLELSLQFQRGIVRMIVSDGLSLWRQNSRGWAPQSIIIIIMTASSLIAYSSKPENSFYRKQILIILQFPDFVKFGTTHL